MNSTSSKQIVVLAGSLNRLVGRCGSGPSVPWLALVLGLMLAGFGTLSCFAEDLLSSALNAGGSPIRPATNFPVKSPRTNSLPDTNLDTNRINVLDDKYQLAVGDRLSFRIAEDEDDPKTILVTDSGEIEVPYIGRYPATGKTCKELAGQLKFELEKKYYFQATVIISVDAVTTRGIVYLVGPVQRPGPLEIPRDETLTLSKAIMRAGGFTDLADQKQVRITRDGKGGADDRQVFVVNVYQILNKGNTENDIVLKPGDLVFVPERLLRF